MRAVTQEVYGPPEVLRVSEIERPEVTADEVCIRVSAAGLDRGVWHLMTGLPYLVRVAGYGIRAPKQPVLGTDVAGRVESVGRDVKRFRVGDEVFGTCTGSFAEFAVARDRQLAHKPENLSFEEAAALPVSGLTALEGLRDVAQVREGQSVLIVGAAGGVGSFAVQIARSLGAEVTGVCSTAKIGFVRSLGAEHVVDYTREDFTEQPARYDVIFDTAGNRPLSQLRRALTRDGTLVIVGGENGGRWLGGTDRQLRAILVSPFLRQRLRTFIAKNRAEDLEHLRELAEAGRLESVVDRAYSLNEAPDAIRDLEAGQVRGKAVITVAR